MLSKTYTRREAQHLRAAQFAKGREDKLVVWIASRPLVLIGDDTDTIRVTYNTGGPELPETHTHFRSSTLDIIDDVSQTYEGPSYFDAPDSSFVGRVS